MTTHKKHQMQTTSLQAFEEIKGSLGERHLLIFNTIKAIEAVLGDATDQEIKQYLNKPDANFVKPRRYELVNRYKRVGFSQKRTCKVTGKTVLAWKTLRRPNEVR